MKAGEGTDFGSSKKEKYSLPPHICKGSYLSSCGFNLFFEIVECSMVDGIA
uniref:Uncharacterized protein n=1 Tax=Anguilla anguilla TaxID=7936 RepID=A0A0E9W6X3_ANGAN